MQKQEWESRGGSSHSEGKFSIREGRSKTRTRGLCLSSLRHDQAPDQCAHPARCLFSANKKPHINLQGDLVLITHARLADDRTTGKKLHGATHRQCIGDFCGDALDQHTSCACHSLICCRSAGNTHVHVPALVRGCMLRIWHRVCSSCDTSQSTVKDAGKH